MERLTRRTDEGKVAYALLGPGECVDAIDLLYVWGDRLAAYEDTGLGPEEIKIILERYRAFRSAISDETGQPMVSWTRAGEICRAEKDGRLAVLPPNDTLTLEQLREMGEDWVWIKLLEPHYGMNTGYYIKRPKVPDRDSFQCGYPNIWMRGLSYSLYGDTWLAYRRKPEEGTV